VISPGRVRRVSVRLSPVHGRGVFALTDLAAGERILDYRGEAITWAEAQQRYENAVDQLAGHTFFFDRGDGWVIDGGRGGNSSRWLNHGCQPNCEPINVAGRIAIHTQRPIRAGEELLIDYQLILDEPPESSARAAYACRCTARSCRGTMLAT
jgi:SET domain-containing protein